MKITCQSCSSKYTVSDEKVQGKTVKIKCRKCGATILVNSSGATNGGPGDAVSTGDGSTYLVNVADGDQRSMTLQEIVTAYNGGVVTADTYIWADGMADWSPLSGVEAVVSALNAGAAAAEAPAPEAPAYAPEPPTQIAQTPSPVAAAPVAAEPAPRAAARRDPARRSQDLFGGGMAAQRAPADDVATSAPLFSAGAAAPGMTGQRDENSTLFSLSALTAKAATPGTGGASKTTATKEDSGLIDLKALAENAGGSAAPASSLVPDHAGLFPLGAPAIVAAPAPSLAPAEEAKKKSPLPIIIGGVVALGAIVGAFMVMKGGDEKAVPSAQPVAAQSAPAPAATPTASATAASADSATAAASASPEPSASAAAAPKKGGRGGPGRGGGKGPGKGAAGAAPAGAAAAPAAPAKPARGNCGCAPGDLMCAMKCSAGGK